MAGIDFQQFLKNKMATTAYFLLTQNIDDVRSIKGKVMKISPPYVLYGYKVAISLAGIDFQQFLKNKMAATANFLLTQNIDDVRSIKGKVMNISSPNVVYGYKVA